MFVDLGDRLRCSMSSEPSEVPVLTPPSCSVVSCFRSGDVRVNEHAALSTMHTLFAREHNRVGEYLL